ALKQHKPTKQLKRVCRVVFYAKAANRWLPSCSWARPGWARPSSPRRWFGSHIYHVHMINKKMLLGVLHQISRWITHFGHGHIDFSLAKILMTGLIVEAFVFAIILYIVTEVFWRWMVIRNWKSRPGHKRQEDAL
ncbi:DUF2062 domain-containing protein, partial [Acinetobacter nosocomialis]|nr:DUF2062 domain-containing protein [Acinetobacter nosocomialis]